MRIDNYPVQCTGCAACANICPKQAITMKENDEGFFVPAISEACVSCGSCVRICPQLSAPSKFDHPECWAVQAEDSIRKVSSSGGAFTVLAQHVLARHGVVCGCAMNDGLLARHIIIDREEDLPLLRGSKYVQSFIAEDLYIQIRTLLKQKRYVLFSGTPCQVAGLSRFLGKEIPDTLLTVDLICSKVTPQKLLKKYVADMFEKGAHAVEFRNKAYGWGASTVSCKKTDGSIATDKNWFRMFLNSLSMNESCINCNYMSITRTGDITIGDFWRITDFEPDMDDGKGVSLILTNSEKGRAFFNELLWQKKKQMTTSQAIHGNRALLVPFIPHVNRKRFSARIYTEPFSEVVNDCLSHNYDIGILNWWWNSNRGAVLTCYALQEIIKKIGYNPFIIKHIPYQYYINTYEKNSPSKEFAEKYLTLTDWVHTKTDMYKLNARFPTFIVGSDQIWCHDLNYFLFDFYYLNFVDIDKKKISYAASFGTPDHFTGPKLVADKVRYYLSRFDAISVRERRGVDICSNEFEAEATLVLDPVLLATPDIYEPLIKDSKKDFHKQYIAFYIVHPHPEKFHIMEKISQETGLYYIDIKGDNSIEDFVAYIKNASFVVSDSFHASCFSIIFHKQFVTIDEFNNDARFHALADLTGLHNHFVKMNDFNYSNIEKYKNVIDWNIVDERINKEREKSLNWLNENLRTPKQKAPKNIRIAESFWRDLDLRLNRAEGKLFHFDTLMKRVADLEEKLSQLDSQQKS